MKKLITLTLVCISLLGAQTIHITAKQQADLGVRTQEVTKMDTISFPPYNGVVTLDKKDIILIGPRVEAIIEEIYVRKFEHVKKGQKLFAIRSNELLNLQKEYIEALILSENINREYERDSKLYSEGIIAQKRFLNAQKEKKNSDLKVKLSQNELLSCGLEPSMVQLLEKTHMPVLKLDIVAPREGVIFKIDANIGETVTAQSSVVGINAQGKRFIEISVPVKVLPDLSIGDVCAFDTYSAKISSISNVVNSSSQSVQVRALIENADDILINKVYEVVISKSIEGTFKIKKSALVFSESKAYIFKKSADGFEVLSAKIMGEGPVCYIVKADLKEKDELAVSSTSALLSAMENPDE
ncbi:efflux RND transporter periplasmic adaptor subunit [bacterium]|nr:efflux RND transporter periplasmic adaptor subunit [bacterium]MBU1989782.1 efflux RND transporter periplasmic adaptor subunit [bacterium]